MTDLKAPESPGTATGRATDTDTEQVLLRIAGEVLRRDDVDPHADLFDLGTTSLDLIRLLVRTKQEFGVALTGAELGDRATVEQLAACVDGARRNGLGGQTR